MIKSTTFLKKDYPFLSEHGYFYQLVKDRKLTKIKHNHDFFEIVAVIKGEVFHNVNGKTEIMHGSDFTVLSPSDEHFFERQSDDAYLFSVSVLPEKFTEIIAAFERSVSYGQVYKLNSFGMENEMAKLPTIRLPEQKFFINAVITELMAQAIKSEFSYENKKPASLQSAIEKMRSPENVGGGVKRFAELAGYSATHLGRLIKKYYNVTAYEFLHGIRMSLAAEYLEKSSFSIETVAEYTGFSSPSQFYSSFKKHYALSPNEYRKKLLAIS